MKRLLTLLAALSTFAAVLAQDTTGKKYPFRAVEIIGHTGSHLYTGQKLANELNNGYSSLEFKYSWQTTDRQSWAAAYNYPAFGLGWYSGYIGDIDVFGSPHALYGFVNFPLGKQKKNQFFINPELGLTYNLKPYNVETNELNDAIGAKFAVYFSLGFEGELQLNRELDLIYGVDFTHFSNGRTVTPNYGLNMYGVQLGMKYNFNALQKKFDKSVYTSQVLPARFLETAYRKPHKKRQSAILLYQALGTVQNNVDAGTDKRYLVSSTVLEFQHKFNEMHGFSAGLNGFYDGSVVDEKENPTYPKYKTTFFPAMHVGYDFWFWKMAVRLQYGYCFTPAGRDVKGGAFLRPAVQYQFAKNWFAQVGLKTFNGATADWVEFGAGYRLWQK